MTTINIVPYSADQSPYVIAEFEEVLRHSALCYSMRHLIQAGISSQESFDAALVKSMEICNYAGINIAHHFKQIFVCDMAAGTMYTDWIMSKKGFKLVLMQYPQVNEQIAHWIWEMAA